MVPSTVEYVRNGQWRRREAVTLPRNPESPDSSRDGGSSPDRGSSPGGGAARRAGFVSGARADLLPPGPQLAALADEAWEAGLGELGDDELIGLLRAARRLASRAAAMELAVVADLAERRRAIPDRRDGADPGEHVDAEVAAALTLTPCAAARLQDLALGLARLPSAGRALAAGRIDQAKAAVIVAETSALDDGAAAAVATVVIRAAAAMTTGQLRAECRQLVIFLDPAAALRRKEAASKHARVEFWREDAGTCALSGRDLPPGLALAADKHVTAAAEFLRAQGAEGTLSQLRARAYLGLLCGLRAESLVPANRWSTSPGRCTPSGRDDPSGPREPADRGGASGSRDSAGRGGPASSRDPAGRGGPTGSRDPASSRDPAGRGGPASCGEPADRACPFSPGEPASRGEPGGRDVRRRPGWPALTGSVNLTLPMSTWLGWSQSPGDVPGFGPLDATDSRDLADAIADHPATRWCLTLLDSDGHPMAHGCAGKQPPPAGRPGPAEHSGPPPTGPSKSGPPSTGPPAPGPSTSGPPTSSPSTSAPPAPSPSTSGPDQRNAALARWLSRLRLIPLAGPCDHPGLKPRYRPSARLQHLVCIRRSTCTFPGCRQPARRCDIDHTLAFDHGGLTCLCNLGPLCRRHHRCKQAEGWNLTQATPGEFLWTTPSGRQYTTKPATYPR